MKNKDTMWIVKIILCIFLPPVAAFLQVGLSLHFWINLVLCFLLVWLGGIIHALWLVLTDKK
ncbi:MAG: YqaE/Pmp3 family membrane protein [Dehalococcoidia bacterium]